MKFIKPLKEVTYEQFKEFLDSLDEERKTWSLDLQHLKNDKEFYESNIHAIICVYNEEVIGLCNCYKESKCPKMVEVSFVVKKDYQSQGIGSTLLKRVEWDAKRHSIKHITAKHYKDNIASHKAFLKAGYKEWTIDKKLFDNGYNSYQRIIKGDTTFDFKIKEIR